MKTAAVAVTLLFFLLPAIGASEEFNTPRNVQVGGEFARRPALTEKRLAGAPFDLDLLVQDVARKSESARRFEEYEGDVSGRTLGALSSLGRITGRRSSKADSLFERILSCQAAEGYFGIDQQPLNWDHFGRQVFGHGRLLAGLVQYYRMSNDPRALASAERLADYLLSTLPSWTTRHAGHPWSDTDPLIRWGNADSERRHFIKTHMTSILESLMMLQQTAPKPERLQAAARLVELFPEFGQYHSHSFLNTMVGMAMLYDLDRDPKLLSRLETLYWRHVKPSVPVDGGVCEFFPTDRRTEGCSVVDWIRLNLYLWKVTHDTAYLDEAENAWYNALDFHQTANGAFGHAVRTPNGYAEEYAESWWCCTMHGLQAYCDLIDFSAVSRGNQVWVNFYIPGEFDLTVNGGRVHFIIDTAYPQQGNITLRCSVAKPTGFTLHLRVPQWAREAELRVNGRKEAVTRTGGLTTLSRTWKSSDAVELRLPMSLRALDESGANLLESAERSREPYTVSFYYGPLLLAVDLKNNGRFPSLLFFDPRKDYRVAGEEGPFSRPAAHFMLPAIIDRLTPTIDGFESTAVLAPISEQTGFDSWSDEWRRFHRNGEEPIRRTPVMTRLPVRFSR